MIDSIELLGERIAQSAALEEFGLKAGEYAIVTLHRPSNVDDAAVLTPIVDSLVAAAKQLPVIFAAHPRTMKSLNNFELKQVLEGTNRLVRAENLSEHTDRVLADDWHNRSRPPLSDG